MHRCLVVSTLVLVGACGADPTPADQAVNSQIADLFGDPNRSPAACVEASLTVEHLCLAPAQWKELVGAGCRSFGMELQKLGVANPGKCEGEQGNQASFQCCPRKEPGNPPPPPACTASVLGDDKSCKAEPDWKAAAARACSEKGLRLDHVSFDGRCGDAPGSFTHVKYECCKIEGPPPPPKTCEVADLGDGKTCSAEASWKEAAQKACSEKGLRLEGVKFADACGDAPGSYLHAKYGCCR